MLVSLTSLVTLPSTTQSQQPQRFRFDTGVITPAAGQILRVTFSGGDTGTHEVGFLVRGIRYMAEGCDSEGVCRHGVAAVDPSSPLLLNANEAA